MGESAHEKVIHMPLRRRLRLWRLRMLPLTVWLLATGIVIVLLGRQYEQVGLIEGIVDVYEVAVAPLSDGIVRGVSIDLFENVEEGQVLALMDDTLVRAELLTAEVALQRLRAELEAARTDASIFDLDQETERRRFLMDLEGARLAYLDRVVQQERDKVDLTRLEIQMQQEKDQVDHGILDRFTYEQTQLTVESLRTQIREHETAMLEANSRIENIRKRLNEYETGETQVGFSPALESLALGIQMQENLVHQISEKLQYLVLRSPIKGSVARIDYRPGSTVLAGVPILHIADPEGARVVAFVREDRTLELEVGEQVEIFTRSNPEDITLARILNISPRMEEYPLQLIQNLAATPWGRPVLVGDLPPDKFTPGQSVLVRTQPKPFFENIRGWFGS